PRCYAWCVTCASAGATHLLPDTRGEDGSRCCRRRALEKRAPLDAVGRSILGHIHLPYVLSRIYTCCGREAEQRFRDPQAGCGGRLRLLDGDRVGRGGKPESRGRPSGPRVEDRGGVAVGGGGAARRVGARTG